MLLFIGLYRLVYVFPFTYIVNVSSIYLKSLCQYVKKQKSIKSTSYSVCTKEYWKWDMHLNWYSTSLWKFTKKVSTIIKMKVLIFTIYFLASLVKHLNRLQRKWTVKLTVIILIHHVSNNYLTVKYTYLLVLFSHQWLWTCTR